MAPDCVPWDEDSRSWNFVREHPDGGTFEEIGRCLGVPAAEVQEIARQAIGKLRRTLGAPARADIGERSVRLARQDEDEGAPSSDAPYEMEAHQSAPYTLAIDAALGEIEELDASLHLLIERAREYQRRQPLAVTTFNIGERWEIELT